MPSNFWTLPEAPNLWKVHLVIWMVRELQHQASFTSEKPLGRDEPSDRSFRHFPFQSWPKPKITWAVYILYYWVKTYLTAVCGELAIKEEVDEVDLEENVGEVEELTGEEPECVEVVILPDIGCQTLRILWVTHWTFIQRGMLYVFSSNQGISWSPWVRSLHFDQLVYKKEHF